MDSVRICRYEHKEIWRISLLITHTFFQCPARHQNSLCLCCKGTAVKSSRGDGKLWQRKRRPRRLYTLLETQPIASREYISLEKPVFNIGLMPLLLENAHTTALLSRVMNLVKETVEHLNPNQIADDGPAALRNSKRRPHRGAFMLRWPGEWFNGSGWPSAITTAGRLLQNLL